MATLEKPEESEESEESEEEVFENEPEKTSPTKEPLRTIPKIVEKIVEQKNKKTNQLENEKKKTNDTVQRDNMEDGKTKKVLDKNESKKGSGSIDIKQFFNVEVPSPQIQVKNDIKEEKILPEEDMEVVKEEEKKIVKKNDVVSMKQQKVNDVEKVTPMEVPSAPEEEKVEDSRMDLPYYDGVINNVAVDNIVSVPVDPIEEETRVDSKEVDVMEGKLVKEVVKDVLVRSEVVQMCEKPRFNEKRQLKKFSNLLFMGLNGWLICVNCSDLKGLCYKESFHDLIFWKYPLNKSTWDPTINSRVIVYFEPLNEILYCSYRYYLYCFDANKGTIFWKSKVPNDGNAIISLSEGVYTVGISHLQRFDKTTGKESLHKKLKGAWSVFNYNNNSSFFADKKYLYVFAGNGIFMLDRIKDEFVMMCFPEVIKRVNLKGLKYDEENLILSTNGFFSVFNTKSKSVVRNTKIFKTKLLSGKTNFGVAMMLRNKTSLIIASAERVFSFHPLTHVKHWECKWVKCVVKYIDSGQGQNTLNQDEKQIYVAGGGIVGAIEAKSGRKIWVTKLPDAEKVYLSTVLISEKNLFFVGCRGLFYALDTIKGRILCYTNLFKTHFGKSHFTFSHFSKHSTNLDLCSQPFLTSNK